MTRLGIIGLGHMGKYHYTLARELASVTAVVDTNTHIAVHDSCITSTDYKAILEFVDAVIIATPTPTHFEIARFFLENGKHVLCEKPLTPTLTQAQTLFSIAYKNNLVLHVGHIERFNGAVQELKKIIHQPFLIETERIGIFNQRVEHDSVVLDLMIHDIDMVLQMIGSSVTTVHSVGKNVVSKQQTDVASAQLFFANGSIAHLMANRATQIQRRRMRIHQQNAVIELDFANQDISIHKNTRSSITLEHNSLSYRQAEIVEHVVVFKGNPLKNEIEYFIKSIPMGAISNSAVQDLAALELTLAIMESCNDQLPSNQKQSSLEHQR